MSIAPNTLRKLRIIAIPLTWPKIKAPPNTPDSSHALTYYQFQLSPTKIPTAETLERKGSRSRWSPEGGIGKWITTKAADSWAGLGKAKGGWKLKVYEFGERLVDRLEFEELALKSIDPSLGPSFLHPGAFGKGSEDVKHPELKIPLVYPPSIKSGSVILNELRALVAYRTPRHRQGFYKWMIIAPFTAPFIIIPIIPNLPFFFCAWRSWSHYKAYRASEYLQRLLDADALVPEASEALDAVYKDFSPKRPAGELHEGKSEGTSKPPPPPSHPTPTSLPHDLLLTRDAVPAILNIFGLNSSAGADILRAVEQARVRVESGRTAL